MADTKMLAEKVEAARQLVPVMLRDVKPDVLASSILPTLLKPWPDSSRAAFGVGNDEEPRRQRLPPKERPDRAPRAPQTQEEQAEGGDWAEQAKERKRLKKKRQLETKG